MNAGRTSVYSRQSNVTQSQRAQSQLRQTMVGKRKSAEQAEKISERVGSISRTTMSRAFGRGGSIAPAPQKQSVTSVTNLASRALHVKKAVSAFKLQLRLFI